MGVALREGQGISTLRLGFLIGKISTGVKAFNFSSATLDANSHHMNDLLVGYIA